MSNLTLQQGRKLTFRKLPNVNNPNSIHGIYPYRGKISAIDAAQIIRQLPKRGTLLDSFCGTGTIIYEAKKLGFNVIGVDSNPIAVQIAKGKFLGIDIGKSIDKINYIILKSKNENRALPLPKKAQKYFHEKTGAEIMSLMQYYEEFNDYEKAVFLGTICLAARGCNHYRWSSTQIGLISEDKKYINFYQKFVNKLKKHYYPIDISGSKILLADTRNLSKFVKENDEEKK